MGSVPVLWFGRAGVEPGLMRREADLQKSECAVAHGPLPQDSRPASRDLVLWEGISREAPGSWDGRLVTPLAETLPF